MDTEMLSESELDDQLYECDPVNRAALDDEQVRAALTRMQRTIEPGAQREAPSHFAQRLLYRHRWVTLGAAAAAVAIASLVGVEALTGGGTGHADLPLAVPPAAAAQLFQWSLGVLLG